MCDPKLGLKELNKEGALRKREVPHLQTDQSWPLDLSRWGRCCELSLLSLLKRAGRLSPASCLPTTEKVRGTEKSTMHPQGQLSDK